MIAEKDPYIGSAYNQLQIISQDRQKRLEYEAREKAIRDHNQFMYEAEQRGIKQGIQQGMEQSIRIFILDSLEEGIPKEKTLAKLQRFFNLTEEKAEQYFLDVQDN